MGQSSERGSLFEFSSLAQSDSMAGFAKRIDEFLCSYQDNLPYSVKIHDSSEDVCHLVGLLDC